MSRVQTRPQFPRVLASHNSPNKDYAREIIFENNEISVTDISIVWKIVTWLCVRIFDKVRNKCIIKKVNMNND